MDDHPIVREGLASLINREPDLNVCGEAEDVPTGLSAIEELDPDLVIVDISLSGRSGLDLIKDIRVRRPDLPMPVLSVHDESVYAERVLRAGANGYIMKGETARTQKWSLALTHASSLTDTLPKWHESWLVMALWPG